MLNQKEHTVFEETKIMLNELSAEDENFVFRLLEEGDFHKKYFELLSFLTASPSPRIEDWMEQYKKIKQNPIYIFVIEDKQNSVIVGSITCLIEFKFIRNLGKVSHIEDVVIHPEYRNKKFGSKLLQLAVDFSKKIGCYKVILDSRDDAIRFYEKFGFQKRSEGMALYF